MDLVGALTFAWLMGYLLGRRDRNAIRRSTW